MKATRFVAILSATAAAMLMAARPAEQANPADEAGPRPAANAAVQVVLVPVPLPLTGDADQVLMAAATKTLQSMSALEQRGVMIFEFRAKDGESIGDTKFERALSVARFLAGDEFRRVRTIAYVPASIEGHAVLPVLACEEIVIHPDAQLGAAGKGERTIDATMRAAYQELAERRRTVPVPIVLGMLDPQVSVLEVQLVGGGTRYVLGDELEALRNEVEVWKESTLVPAGALLSLSGREMRVKPGFACQLAADRKELAGVLHIAPDTIRENVVAQEVWRALRVDLLGRITARSVDDVIRALRDAERDDSANLVLLQIDSPGGPAAPAMRLVHQITSLDASKVRIVALVSREARSVAALIALSADETYASENAVLGGPGDAAISAADCEALRQPIQEWARLKNRDWSLPLGLVDPNLEVFRCRREGTGAVRYLCDEERASLPQANQWQRENPLTLAEGISGLQAHEYGLVVDHADRPESVLARYQIDEQVAVVQRNPVVSAVERLAAQAWFARTLLFIAFFALISEASAPGIGVAGFLSGLCFLLFFWCQFLNGTAGWLELILFLGGIVCLSLEIFVLPGFGVFGVGGTIMVLASIVLASQTFIIPRNAYQLDQIPDSVTTLAIACGGILSAAWFMRRFLAESWLFRALTLSPPSEDVDLDRLEALVDWTHLAGKRGITTTQLTPSGKASFGDDVVNVISDGILIPKDAAVRVIEVRGNRVLVEPLEES